MDITNEMALFAPLLIVFMVWPITIIATWVLRKIVDYLGFVS